MAVEHVFVLMLENRSFDHLFGLSQRQLTLIPSSANFSLGAPDRCASDPAHEFDNVQHQINNGAMDGFDDDLQRKGFVASQLPTLNELAQRYVLFDNWFSSVPGPTWPNRFFIHAASSGGLCTSPTGLRSAGAVISPTEKFQFENGTLFDLFDKKFPSEPAWRVYHGDVTPQVLALPGMVGKYYKGAKFFRSLYPTTAQDGTRNDDGFGADVNS
ncbi:MAG TPA: alkaline phosphatase family protein, partial [Steroidobacteraceae bacterium]|nr:alkaline phosphatase family protein [Steroidobacteraceae bacterium]